LALDIQQRKAKHGDRRNDTDTETESSLDSTDTHLYKWGDYLMTAQRGLLQESLFRLRTSETFKQHVEILMMICGGWLP